MENTAAVPPPGVVDGGACARGIGWSLAGVVNSCGSGALYLLGVVAEVDLRGDIVPVDGDEAVVVIRFETPLPTKGPITLSYFWNTSTTIVHH